jgi:CheY-like chemotaxis protein
MALLIIAIVSFIIADILIRYFSKKYVERKARREREAVLTESIRLDYSSEAKSLKRAEVKNPKARILCVDDEDVILDSFRKILVLDGYSVDTVNTGKEALGLIQTHNYDFVFTDLKMPEMDGVEVTKAVKHLRPDIDVVIITGYATVETAVETMKYGAMDYVQKPFTDDELLDFARKILIKRQDKIQKQLKPTVHVSPAVSPAGDKKDVADHSHEFAIPGGVFISEGHTWLSMGVDGKAKVGIDDFAKKLIGKIDSIEFPNLGMAAKAGRPLFTVRQGNRTMTFNSPVSGKVVKINNLLNQDTDVLDITPYDTHWICIIDAEDFDVQMKKLKIGKTAVSFYQDDIEHFIELRKKSLKTVEGDGHDGEAIYIGVMENLDDLNWRRVGTEFFRR